MARPSALPEWATSTNYDSGPDSGQATRLEPTSGEKANGWWRGMGVPARKLNWLLGLLCDWAKHLDEDRVRAASIRRRVFGTRSAGQVFTLTDDGRQGEPITSHEGATALQLPPGRYFAHIHGTARCSRTSDEVFFGVTIAVGDSFDPGTYCNVEVTRYNDDPLWPVVLDGGSSFIITDPENQRLRVWPSTLSGSVSVDIADPMILTVFRFSSPE